MLVIMFIGNWVSCLLEDNAFPRYFSSASDSSKCNLSQNNFERCNIWYHKISFYRYFYSEGYRILYFHFSRERCVHKKIMLRNANLNSHCTSLKWFPQGWMVQKASSFWIKVLVHGNSHCLFQYKYFQLKCLI